MKRTSIMVFAFALLACAVWQARDAFGQAGWTTLFDGKSLDNFSIIGDANWKLADGVVQADKGVGFLVSKEAYGDFTIRVEFWTDDDANSGVFLRCQDRGSITPLNSYEVNVFDKRPDPSYGTGAIVEVAKVSTALKAGGKWNVYDITAKGPNLTVVLNGSRTVDVSDSKHARGPIALQYAGGVVKFRKVEIRPM